MIDRLTGKGRAGIVRCAAILLALVALLGGFAKADDDDLPPPRGGESTVPRGLFLGAGVEVVLTSDRAAIGVAPRGSDRIESYLRGSATFMRWVDETLEGSFVGMGKPSDFEMGPPVTVGMALGIAFIPGLEAEIGVASYRGEARAIVPIEIQTDAGATTLRGEITTTLQGLVVDATMRKRWRVGSLVPGVGAGVRMHRMAPRDSRVAVDSIRVYFAPPESHSEFSPIVEIGLGRAIGEKLVVGLSSELAGRSLPEVTGGESWVFEPGFRIWVRFKLAPDRR